MDSFPNLAPVCCFVFSSKLLLLDLHTVSQEAGNVVCYSYLFKKFPLFVVNPHSQRFGIVNKAEVDVFWNSLAFLMIQLMFAI